MDNLVQLIFKLSRTIFTSGKVLVWRSTAVSILGLALLAIAVSAMHVGAQTGTALTAGSDTNDGFPLTYHGGQVMLGPHDVYFIWYGNWAGNTALNILPDFVNGLNGSAYFNILSIYSDNTGARPDDLVALSGQAFDNYSQGTSLTATGVFNVINTALVNGSLPYDPNGVYFVLTSPDVAQTSNPTGGPGQFCAGVGGYCGWHYHGAFEGRVGRVAFVGNPPAGCSCTPQNVSPNGNAGADGMASVIAHELSEATTDPDLQSWHDDNPTTSLQQEVSDKCNFVFGPTQFLPNGAQYNITLGARNFWIQEQWTNGNGCVMSLPPPPPPPSPSPTPTPIPRPTPCVGRECLPQT